MIAGPWVEDIADFIAEKDIKALYLIGAKGWRCSDYSFLSKLTSIEELKVSTAETPGIKSIESMSALEELSITTSTSEEVDFSKLPNLQICYLLWWKGAESILRCNSLKRAYFDGLKLKDFAKLSSLTNLTALTIANSPLTSLEFLESLGTLSELELYNCRKLEEFEPIRQRTTLKKLVIDGSKLLSELNFVKDLKNLEVLNISECGNIKSLAPLSQLKALKAVAFAGAKTEIEDGDLAVLEGLPQLSMLMFQARKHYTHKLIKPWNWNNFNIPDVLLEKR
jgi:protein phosphatase 1 regulatory subunit 7